VGNERSMTEEEKQRRRDSLLEAAKKLFLRFGYSKTTMDMIAEKSYISKGTIYLYFQNKEELFHELVEREALGMQRFLARSLKDEKSVAKQLQIIFYKTLEYLEQNPFLKSILQRDMEVISPRNIEYVLTIENKYISSVEEYVQTGIEKGEIEPFDTRIIAYTLYKVFEAFSYIATMENGELDKEATMAFIGHLVDGMIKGLCGPPRSRKKP